MSWAAFHIETARTALAQQYWREKPQTPGALYSNRRACQAPVAQQHLVTGVSNFSGNFDVKMGNFEADTMLAGFIALSDAASIGA